MQSHKGSLVKMQHETKKEQQSFQITKAKKWGKGLENKILKDAEIKK